VRFALSNVQSIQEGTNTSVWESHIQGCLCFGGADIDPLLCFSISTLKETIDLKADNINSRKDYVQSFQGLLGFRDSTAGKFVQNELTKAQEDQKHARQQERDEKQELITKKYDHMRQAIHKKYNVT